MFLQWKNGVRRAKCITWIIFASFFSILQCQFNIPFYSWISVTSFFCINKQVVDLNCRSLRIILKSLMHCYNALWWIRTLNNLGPNQRTLKKNIFIQSALISAILTHFEKNSIIKLCMAPLNFLFSKTIINIEKESISSSDKCIIDDSFNCTFIFQGCEIISLG